MYVASRIVPRAQYRQREIYGKITPRPAANFKTSDCNQCSFLQESQISRAECCQSQHHVSRPVYPFDIQRVPCVPNQMPDSVPRVICERQREHPLDPNLRSNRQSPKRGGNASRLKMETKRRRSQVGEGENIDPTRDSCAGDPVCSRPVPSQLRLVDTEVRRDRAEFALGDEDRVCLILGDIFRGVRSRGSEIVRQKTACLTSRISVPSLKDTQC